jgi:hypothetical protein
MKRRKGLLIAVPVLIALVDFVSRVHVGRGDAERDFRVPSIPDSPPARSLQSVRTDLAAWFPQYGIAPGAEVEGAVVHAGNLVLGGIFTAGDLRVAVLFAEKAGARPDRYQVAEGDQVLGMKVEKIGPRSVTLSEGDTGKTLEIFRRSARTSVATAPIPEAVAAAPASGGAPAPVAKSPKPVASASTPVAAGKSASGGVKEVKAIELKPGEKPAFATDLPIVELDTSAVRDRDPPAGSKK